MEILIVAAVFTAIIIIGFVFIDRKLVIIGETIEKVNMDKEQKVALFSNIHYITKTSTILGIICVILLVAAAFINY